VPSVIRCFLPVDVQVPPLDPLSSARLFLKRVRRQLTRADFEEVEPLGGSVGVDDRRVGTVAGNDLQATVNALLSHPLLQMLVGNPGRIRRAAEQVTPQLASIRSLS